MKTPIHVNTRARKARASVTGELVGVRVQPELAALIDDWRRAQPDIPNRPEAIRRLVEQALDGAEKRRR